MRHKWRSLPGGKPRRQTLIGFWFNERERLLDRKFF